MLDFVFLISPIFWALLCSAGFAAWTLLTRLILKDEKDFIAVGGVNETLASIIMLLLILFIGIDAGSSRIFDLGSIPTFVWLVIAASSILYTVFAYLNYRAFQTIEATERAVVSQIQVGWVALLGVLLLGEHPSALQIAGMVFVVGGAFLCTYRKSRSRWKVEGVQIIVLASIIAGTGALCDKIAVTNFPILLYSIWLFILPAMMAFVLMGKKALPRMKAVWDRHGARNFILLAISSTLPYVAFLLALRFLPASEVVPLVNTNIVLTALGGMLLLGERDAWKQKVIGALIAFAGAWMIGG